MLNEFYEVDDNDAIDKKYKLKQLVKINESILKEKNIFTAEINQLLVL